MNAQPHEIVETLLAAWNEGSAVERLKHLKALLSQDAHYTDPDDDVYGADAVNNVMTRVKAGLPPDAEFCNAGATSTREHIHFTWHLIGPENSTLATGHDVLATSAGRVTRVIAFFDPAARP